MSKDKMELQKELNENKQNIPELEKKKKKKQLFLFMIYNNPIFIK